MNNIVGRPAGIGLLAPARRKLQRQTVVWILAAGTVLTLIAVGLHIASFPSMPPPHDGVVTAIE